MTDGLERRFAARLARAERLARLWLEPRLLDLGITLSEFRLVGQLFGERDGLTQRELSERLGVRPATLSVAVAALERRGVVERVADPTDGRAKRVRLGDRVPKLPGVARLLAQLDEIALEGISDSDRAALMAALARVVSNLERARARQGG